MGVPHVKVGSGLRLLVTRWALLGSEIIAMKEPNIGKPASTAAPPTPIQSKLLKLPYNDVEPLAEEHAPPRQRMRQLPLPIPWSPACPAPLSPHYRPVARPRHYHRAS